MAAGKYALWLPLLPAEAFTSDAGDICERYSAVPAEERPAHSEMEELYWVGVEELLKSSRQRPGSVLVKTGEGGSDTSSLKMFIVLKQLMSEPALHSLLSSLARSGMHDRKGGAPQQPA
jgi:hypothetical protein